MKLCSQLTNSFIGFFCGTERAAYVIPFPVEFNASYVFVARSDERDTFIPGSVVSLLPPVSMVLRWRSLSQVCPAIVRRIFVDMVNLFIWPFAGYPNPDDTMCEILFATDADLDAALIVWEASDVANVDASRWAIYPPQLTGFWRVIKIGLNKLWRKIVVAVLVHHLYIMPHSAVGIKPC